LFVTFMVGLLDNYCW